MIASHHIEYYSLSYLVFFGLLWLSKARRGLRLVNGAGPVNETMLITLHAGGVLLFSIVPAVLPGGLSFVVALPTQRAAKWPVCVVSILAIAAVFLARRLADKNYLSGNHGFIYFNHGFLPGYFFIRILFLTCYETWFRGWLLNDLVAVLDVPPGFVINVCLYALLHVVNGRREILACIPFGLLLCVLSNWVSAAWPAIIIHITFTMSYELHSVKKYNSPSTFII